MFDLDHRLGGALRPEAPARLEPTTERLDLLDRAAQRSIPSPEVPDEARVRPRLPSPVPAGEVLAVRDRRDQVRLGAELALAHEAAPAGGSLHPSLAHRRRIGGPGVPRNGLHSAGRIYVGDGHRPPSVPGG